MVPPWLDDYEADLLEDKPDRTEDDIENSQEGRPGLFYPVCTRPR